MRRTGLRAGRNILRPTGAQRRWDADPDRRRNAGVGHVPDRQGENLGPGRANRGNRVRQKCRRPVQFQRAAETRGFIALPGTCEPAGFWGIYNIRNAQGRIVSKGIFSLERKKPEAVKDSGTRSTAASSKTTTACMAANTRCLSACPRGDASAEFLCANRCRSKLQGFRKRRPASRPPPSSNAESRGDRCREMPPFLTPASSVRNGRRARLPRCPSRRETRRRRNRAVHRSGGHPRCARTCTA